MDEGGYMSSRAARQHPGLSVAFITYMDILFSIVLLEKLKHT
jgi:hypothetical protein